MWTCLTLAATLAPAAVDFVPNPEVRARPLVAAGTKAPGRVLQHGEVVILEGDETIVTVVDEGAYAVGTESTNNDRADITARFFSRYPDEFDQLIVFLTFPDFASFGSSAYYMPIVNDVAGIGLAMFHQAAAYGSAGKLQGFVNMHGISQYGRSVETLADPDARIYSTLGQEFSHRWLAYMAFQDAAGDYHGGMQGRDGAHWSALLDAEGSVQDGYDWVDNLDGSFTSIDRAIRFSPLDLYGMGLLAVGDTPPWFLIENATYLDMTAVEATDTPEVGTSIFGTRTDITIGDVIAQLGPRVPDAAAAPQSFRLAFLLVTHPGQSAAEVVDQAELIDVARRTWEQEAFPAMTGGRGQMCTRVSAPCGAPGARPVALRIDDAAGNDNGILEPGESAVLEVDLLNDGLAAAENVAVTATFDVEGIAATPGIIAGIAPDAQATSALEVTVDEDAVCGSVATIDVTSAVGGHEFRAFYTTDVGVEAKVRAGFAGDDGWVVDPDGTDTASSGAFERAVPEASGTFFIVQPGTDVSGEGFAIVTGATAGAEMEDNDLDGETTLQSPSWNLDGYVDAHLRYSIWFLAFDLDDFSRDASTEDAVILEASDDGAKTWKEIDRVEVSALEWSLREVSLEDVIDPSADTRFRFLAGDRGIENLVEVLIDDVQIRAHTQACHPESVLKTPPPMGAKDDGCGCAVGAPPSAATWFALAALALMTLRRARAV